MDFLRICDETARRVEEGIAGLAGTPAAGAYVRMGADGTPTKKIDQVAEDIVVAYLRESGFSGTLISEECGKANLGEGAGTLFLDPIDGTYNAVGGIPFYALSMAYAEGGTVIRGYVRDLAHGETFYAEKERGAYRNGERIAVSKTRLLEESAMSVYGRKFNPGTVLRLGQRLRRWRLMGASALELCYVAAGRLDGFIDLRDTLRITDAAAGMLICEEAGGIVSDFDGDTILFPDEVTVGKCLVATNGVIHRKVIEYLR
ncbi:MAG: bifunctional fructose-bisphosphatase/inositol-phosphate phosphatase [Methanomicrobiales archaeon]|nr:bifunctional fructose-bisphosphatase/inositol-phosphate phosphatase [Methanomicrobiales archaeon]